MNPWTLAHNPAFSDSYATYVTLYWNGLVRGQVLVAYAQAICDQLNLANVDGR